MNMFIYNITIKIDNDIVDEWLRWQKEIHIPEILGTGLFYEHRFFELLEQDETDGRTFVIQYFANTRKDYDTYIQHHAPVLRDKAIKKWGNQFIAFRTFLQAVQ
jgi:hypothetical protein